jgi:hypothetical protein
MNFKASAKTVNKCFHTLETKERKYGGRNKERRGGGGEDGARLSSM